MTSIIQCRDKYAKRLSEVKLECDAAINDYEAQLEVEKMKKLEEFRQSSERAADLEIVKLTQKIQVLDEIISESVKSVENDSMSDVQQHLEIAPSVVEPINKEPESSDACLEILKNMSAVGRPGMACIEIPNR